MGRQASRRRSATVIDLQAFKSRRAREVARVSVGTNHALPLFDGEPAAAQPTSAPPSGPRARRLSEAEVQHRKRMLSFLRATGRQ